MATAFTHVYSVMNYSMLLPSGIGIHYILDQQTFTYFDVDLIWFKDIFTVSLDEASSLFPLVKILQYFRQSSYYIYGCSLLRKKYDFSSTKLTFRPTGTNSIMGNGVILQQIRLLDYIGVFILHSPRSSFFADTNTDYKCHSEAQRCSAVG